MNLNTHRPRPRVRHQARAEPRMRTMLARARAVMVLGAFVGVGGCINLPPALERELACPQLHAPDNFGNAATCTPSDSR